MFKVADTEVVSRKSTFDVEFTRRVYESHQLCEIFFKGAEIRIYISHNVEDTGSDQYIIRDKGQIEYSITVSTIRYKLSIVDEENVHSVFFSKDPKRDTASIRSSRRNSLDFPSDRDGLVTIPMSKDNAIIRIGCVRVGDYTVRYLDLFDLMRTHTVASIKEIRKAETTYQNFDRIAILKGRELIRARDANKRILFYFSHSFRMKLSESQLVVNRNREFFRLDCTQTKLYIDIISGAQSDEYVEIIINRSDYTMSLCNKRLNREISWFNCGNNRTKVIYESNNRLIEKITL